MNIITNDAAGIFAVKDMIPQGTKVVLFYDPELRMLTIPEAMQLGSMKNLILFDNGSRPFGGYEIGRYVGRDEKAKYVIVCEGLQIMEDENVKVTGTLEEAVKLCQAAAQAPRAKAPRKKKAKAAGTAKEEDTKKASPEEEMAPAAKKEKKDAPVKDEVPPLGLFMPSPLEEAEEREEEESLFEDEPIFKKEKEEGEELRKIRDGLYKRFKELGEEAYEYRDDIISVLQGTSHPVSLKMTLGMNLHNGELAEKICSQIEKDFKELKKEAEKLPAAARTRA